jgi:hypothetical protein
MSDIANTRRLWVVNRHSTFPVLAPGHTGTPEPVEPSPLLHKAAYLSIFQASGDLQMHSASLDRPTVTLLAKLPSPDGPPTQAAILFPPEAEETISYLANGRSFHGIKARKYTASGPSDGHSWENDIMQGTYGYFLVGSASLANLWHVTRVEVDYARRYNFTLVPTQLAHGLPNADFTAITDPTIRSEVQRQWADLQGAIVRHSRDGVVTAAKSIAESLLFYFLVTGGHIVPGKWDLGTLLRKLDSITAGGKNKTNVPLDLLAYYLIQKIRLLYSKTHIDRRVIEGRPMAPELALTVATDLVEVLRCAGFVL